MSEKSKNVAEEMLKAQEKVFLAWKEAMSEYNNNRLMEIFGEETSEAWNDYLELQEKVFSLWKETVLQYQPPLVAMAAPGDLVMRNYRRWWELQEKLLRSWKLGPAPGSAWFSPETMMRFYREWVKVMQDSFMQPQKK